MTPHQNLACNESLCVPAVDSHTKWTGFVSKATPVLGLLALSVVLAFPLLVWGPLLNSHDGPEHISYARHFTEQLWAGELYPRWLAGMNHGLGSPAFFVYPPLPFYVRALLEPAGHLLHFNAFNLAAFLSLFGSGAFAYLWLRNTFDRLLAFIGATLYLTTPYHLSIDFYRRFALSECWALVWIPLIVLFTENLVNNRKRAVVGLAGSYALLMFSHLPTAIMFLPVPLAMAMAWSNPGRRPWTTLYASAGVLLGIGMSAVYWLPAFVHHRYIRASGFFGSFQYVPANDLITLSPQLFPHSPHYNFTSKIAWVVFELTLLLTVCTWVVIRRGRPELKRITVFWLFVCGVAIFSMSQLSFPFWRLIPQMGEAFQFPWRFNIPLCVGLVPVLVTFLGIVPSQPKHARRFLFAFFSVGIALWLAGWAWECSRYATEAAPPPNPAYIVNEHDGWFSAFVQPNLIQEVALRASRQPRARLAGDEGTVVIVKWKPRHIEVLSDTPKGGQIVLSQFYYPAWTAQIDAGAAVPIVPPEPDGLIRVKVPPGLHHVVFLIPFSVSELVGVCISTACGIVWVFLLFGGRPRHALTPARCDRV